MLIARRAGEFLCSFASSAWVSVAVLISVMALWQVAELFVTILVNCTPPESSECHGLDRSA